MGKFDEGQLPVQQQQQQQQQQVGGSGIICGKIFSRFSFKCVVVLLLSFAVCVSALFWVLPRHSNKLFEFDANKLIKHSASAQSYFRLQKPVSDLIPQIPRLEYDIHEELGVPYIKVAVLSMHQANVSTWTDVVIGFLSDRLNASINPVYFMILKSELIDLFLQQSNLTLTNSTFGRPSSFEILKLSGGITIIPKESGSPIGLIPQILFHFTLTNSISQINEYHVELKEQLKLGLKLTHHEDIYVQVTNKNGSTRDPPVVVEASVTSNSEFLPPERLKELAEIITGSPCATNLGLNHSVFGKVKEVRLSSYLNHSIHTLPPSPSPSPSPSPASSPAPSPVQNNYAGPSLSPFPAPNSKSEPPESNFLAPLTAPYGSQLAPSPSPTLHTPDLPPQAVNHPPMNSPSSQLFPGPSPSPGVSYGSRRAPHEQYGAPPPFSPSIAPFPSSFAVGSLSKEIWWSCLFELVLFHLLCSSL